MESIINLELNDANDLIKDKEQDIKEALTSLDYQIEVIFCHTGSMAINRTNMKRINKLKDDINDGNESDILLFSELKLQDIYNFLAFGRNIENINIDNILLENWGLTDAPIKSYYGVINATTVGEWFSQYGNRLFDKNIRYYKGSTEVNQGIRETIYKDPSMFFYYNNGIKILCNKVIKKTISGTNRKFGTFSLENVALVNGAQTAGTIGTIYKEDPEILSDVRLFINIIDLSKEDENKGLLITKLSNTQNRIDGKDFVSLDPTQERLKLELGLLGIQYLYRSGSTIDDPDKQISLEDAIIAQACLCGDISIVSLVKRNIGALTENINKKPYLTLFNKSTNSYAMYNAVQVLREVDKIIKNMDHKYEGRKRLALIHSNRFILFNILASMKNKDDFNSKFIDKSIILSETTRLFKFCWKLIAKFIESNFKDSYPANIFKNVGKLKEVNSFIMDHLS